MPTVLLAQSRGLGSLRGGRVRRSDCRGRAEPMIPRTPSKGLVRTEGASPPYPLPLRRRGVMGSWDHHGKRRAKRTIRPVCRSWDHGITTENPVFHDLRTCGESEGVRVRGGYPLRFSTSAFEGMTGSPAHRGRRGGRGYVDLYAFSRMTAAVRYEHALATPVRAGCAGCPSPAISAILPRPRPSPLSRHPLAPSLPVERILGPSGDSA